MIASSLRPPVTLWIILVAAVVLMFVEVALGSVAVDRRESFEAPVATLTSMPFAR